MDYHLIEYQILQTKTISSVWQIVGRITREIMWVKGLSQGYHMPELPNKKTLIGQEKNFQQNRSYLNNKWINVNIGIVLNINMKGSCFSWCVHLLFQPLIKENQIRNNSIYKLIL